MKNKTKLEKIAIALVKKKNYLREAVIKEEIWFELFKTVKTREEGLIIFKETFVVMGMSFESLLKEKNGASDSKGDPDFENALIAWDSSMIILIKQVENEPEKVLSLVEESAKGFLKRNPEIAIFLLKQNKYTKKIEKIFDLFLENFEKDNDLLDLCLAGFIEFLDTYENNNDRLVELKGKYKKYPRIVHIVDRKRFNSL